MSLSNAWRVSVLIILGFVSILGSKLAGASIFGEEDVILAKILAENIEQLYQLKQILQTGSDTLNLARNVDQGISDSLRAINQLKGHSDPGTFRDLKRIDDILARLQSNYGKVMDSPVKTSQKDTDAVVADAISLNNDLYNYADNSDQIGEQIKSFSQNATPGGATKLTAESMGVMVHIMNQQLRAQATGLKLQAQGLAVQNKKEKDSTTEYLGEVQVLKAAMKSTNVKFEFPRF